MFNKIFRIYQNFFTHKKIRNYFIITFIITVSAWWPSNCKQSYMITFCWHFYVELRTRRLLFYLITLFPSSFMKLKIKQRKSFQKKSFSYYFMLFTLNKENSCSYQRTGNIIFITWKTKFTTVNTFQENLNKTLTINCIN